MTDEQLTEFAKALIACEKYVRGAFELTTSLQDEVDKEAELLSKIRAGIAAAEGCGPVRVMTSAAASTLAQMRGLEVKTTTRVDKARAALKALRSQSLADLSTMFGVLCAGLDEIRDSERALEAAASSEAEQSARLRNLTFSSRPGG